MKNILNLTKNDLNQENLDRIEDYLHFDYYKSLSSKFILYHHKENIKYLLSLVDDDMKIRLIKYHFNTKFAGNQFISLFVQSVASQQLLHDLLKEIVEEHKEYFKFRRGLIELILRKLKAVDQNIIEFLIKNSDTNFQFDSVIRKIDKDRDDLFILALSKNFSFACFPKSKIPLIYAFIKSGHRMLHISDWDTYIDYIPKKNFKIYFDLFFEKCNMDASILSLRLFSKVIKKIVKIKNLSLLEDLNQYLDVDKSQTVKTVFCLSLRDKKIFGPIQEYVNNNPSSKYTTLVNEYLIESIL